MRLCRLPQWLTQAPAPLRSLPLMEVRLSRGIVLGLPQLWGRPQSLLTFPTTSGSLSAKPGAWARQALSSYFKTGSELPAPDSSGPGP